MCIIRISAGKNPASWEAVPLPPLQKLPDNTKFLAIRLYRDVFRSSRSRCTSLAQDPETSLLFGPGVSITH